MNSKCSLLELYFHKYLQYKIVTITILFAYAIAILIPFFTGELKIDNIKSMILVAIISSAVFIIIIIFINEFNYHLDKIPKEIKLLNKTNI